MNRSKISTVLVAALTVALLLVGFGAAQVRAQTVTPTPAAAPSAPDSTLRTVSVGGEGRISAAPDQATISVGVRTQGKTSTEALDENSDAMTALTNSLKAAGVQTKDIQTTDFSIWPQYSSTGTVITGYEVSNMVRITVRDLENFGKVLDAAVKAGGNQVNGIQFGFSDPTAIMEQAREAAMADAQRKAAQLAGLAEVELGTVVSISESGGFAPPMPMMRAESMAMDASVPIESGESTITLNLQVTYQLIP